MIHIIFTTKPFPDSTFPIYLGLGQPLLRPPQPKVLSSAFRFGQSRFFLCEVYVVLVEQTALREEFKLHAETTGDLPTWESNPGP